MLTEFREKTNYDIVIQSHTMKHQNRTNYVQQHGQVLTTIKLSSKARHKTNTNWIINLNKVQKQIKLGHIGMHISCKITKKVL